MASKRYILIGGNPFVGYTGTETFTGLKIANEASTIEEAKKMWETNYEECGGLMLIVDTETNCEIDP